MGNISRLLKIALLGYRIRCRKCGYVWRPRQMKWSTELRVSAKCLSCGIKIHGTRNYEES